MKQHHIRSYAKINLHLRVMSRRDDGFHDLETIFQEIDLYDDLHFQPTGHPGITLETDAGNIPVDRRNLIIRAAERLNGIQGCRITLEKRIPMGAGLGGGSSNAACTLVALNRIWQTGWNEKQLAAMALELGSDVPFFLNGGLALARGRGEQLSFLTAKPDYCGLLIYPNFAISTAWVFQNLKKNLTIKSKKTTLIDFNTFFDRPDVWQQHFSNDLEETVFAAHPELKEIRDRLTASNAFYVRMSGSGSTIFALFEDQKQAVAARSHYDRFQNFIFKPVYRIHRSLH